MDAVEHGQRVLAGILAGRKDLLQLALRHLQPAHFPDPTQRGLYRMCERYLDVTGEVLPQDALADLLRAASAAPGTSVAYEEYYAYLRAMEPTEADVRWSLAQLRDIAAEQRTGEALAQAMEILRKGATLGKLQLKGHQDTRRWLTSRLADIERELNAADSPEGDMRTEGKEMVEEYRSRRTQGGVVVSTGIPELDTVLGGGLERGSMSLIAGFAHSGKSSSVVQMVHQAVVSGKNAVVFTSEMLRSQYRVKIIARHSREPQFGLDYGLNSADIKAGRLDNAGALGMVLNDWQHNPSYGRCYIAQVPRGATVAWVDARLDRISSLWEADLVAIDYLQLLRSEIHRQSEREALSMILKDALQMAITYKDGRGVALVSPWQMGRDAREKAKGGNGYTLAGLAETNEAGASPDNVFSLLEPDGWKGGRRCSLLLQVLKARDSEHGQELTLDADYATCYFTARSGSSHESLLEEELA